MPSILYALDAPDYVLLIFTINFVMISHILLSSIITKKMVVKAVLSRLDLPGDHFDKEQRNTVAARAKRVLVR